jgi:hypothetical protein
MKVKRMSLTFTNEALHEYANAWREYISTLPKTVVETHKLVIIGPSTFEIALKDIPDTIEKDPNVAVQIAKFFAR